MAVPVAPGQAPLRGDYASPPPREPQPDDPIVGREYKVTRKDGGVDAYTGKFLYFMGDALVFQVGNKKTYAYREADDITEVKGGRRRRSRKTKRRVRSTRDLGSRKSRRKYK